MGQDSGGGGGSTEIWFRTDVRRNNAKTIFFRLHRRINTCSVLNIFNGAKFRITKL